MRLMPDQKRILLADGTEVPYDRLLLATGGVSFVPPIEGAEKKGVFTLRTLDDALAIREYAASCQEAVVIGGGLLGLEAARGLKVLGLAETKAILGNGEVRGVVLRDGREFPAQMVLIATGVRSNAGLAAEAGLQVERGVVVNERMLSDAPNIYSAGDAASFRGRSWGIIPVARSQALVAAPRPAR